MKHINNCNILNYSKSIFYYYYMHLILKINNYLILTLYKRINEINNNYFILYYIKFKKI